MTAKQMKKHKCEGTQFSGVKEIFVRHIYDLTEGEAKVIIADGYDGIMYRIAEKNPTDEISHKKPADKDFTVPIIIKLISLNAYS